MINTKLTRLASKIAYRAHDGQTDKAGVPYIFHPIHIAEQMDSEESCIVALLHDVVEDSNITLEILSKYFNDNIIEALRVLTKEEIDDYTMYIKRVKTNKLATKIKLKDLEHNMDLTRLDEITDEDKNRAKKYMDAIRYLKDVETVQKILAFSKFACIIINT